MYKALIFDFDGVIALSEQARFGVLQRVAEDHGLTIENSLFKAMTGATTRNFFKHHFSELDSAVIEQIIEDYTKEYKDKIIDHATPIVETNDFIKRYDGDLPLAVASGSDTKVLETMLNHLAIRDRFQFVFGKEHAKQHKPHPEVYLRVSESLGVPIKDCAIIEDSVHGATAALAAGADTYVFLNGINDVEDFKGMAINGFLRTTEDIEAILHN
jgi:beta-phosphoglucomutase-like phosphatase (HAD superfamily)